MKLFLYVMLLLLLKLYQFIKIHNISLNVILRLVWYRNKITQILVSFKGEFVKKKLIFKEEVLKVYRSQITSRKFCNI
jgi:hypothetical protein